MSEAISIGFKNSDTSFKFSLNAQKTNMTAKWERQVQATHSML